MSGTKKTTERKSLKVAPRVHGRLKAESKRSGMKLEALADVCLDLGLKARRQAA